MNTVPLNTVTDVWETLCSLDERETRALMERFTSEQPFVTAYLMVAKELMEDEAQESPLISLVLLAWQVLTPPGGSAAQISGVALEQAEASNTQWLEQWDAGRPQHEFDAARSMFRGYRQQALLGFSIEVLMSGWEDAPELAPDRLGVEMVHLKTVIDCLDAHPEAS